MRGPKQLSAGAGYVIKLKQRQADDEEHANDFLTHNLNPKLFEKNKYNNYNLLLQLLATNFTAMI